MFSLVLNTTSLLHHSGGYCYPKQLSVRSVAAVWCLGVFFLANFYSSTLISYITAQVPSPLIESVYDLPKKPDVYVAVEEGQAPDGLISRAQSGILKYMNNTLKKKPSIRCARMEQCLDLVVAGSHVFIQVYIKFPKFHLMHYSQQLLILIDEPCAECVH